MKILYILKCDFFRGDEGSDIDNEVVAICVKAEDGS